MPTPITNARQCLTAEAATALDESVAVARRRGHAQTTSLHVVYALLHPAGGGGNATTSSASSASSSSSSPSLLRDALSRARSSAFSPRLQFKALELCFGVALDRLPSSTSSHHQQDAAVDGPPVSNSLMAAIKRSQANQKRNPDRFQFYQQQSCGASSSTSSGVKVELQQLVLAILDDPVVSRVFSDAGFRSSDIKLAVLRPPPPILRFQGAARCPPLFLCNFSSSNGFDAAFSPRGFSFPFSSPGGSQPCSDDGEGNCRRIGEILVRRSGGRNPMLVGAGAVEAALDFAQAVEKHNWTVLPPELRGIKLVSIEKVSALRNPEADRSAVRALLEEIPGDFDTPGTVLSIGDLNEMVRGEGEGGSEQESLLVSEITRLLEVHQGRMWVMGCSPNYETYMKFLSRYPLLDKDWDLQLLPITSVRGGTSGSAPKPSSLMESFVPFVGLFPTAYEQQSPSNIAYSFGPCCEHCSHKYEQEVDALLKEHSTSIEDQHSTNLPFWLHKTNMMSTNNDLDVKKAKDDKSVLNAKIVDLKKKWNEHCQCLHHSCRTISKDQPQAMPCFLDPQGVSEKDRTCDQSSEKPDEMQNQREYGIHVPLSGESQKKDASIQYISLPSNMEQGKEDLVSKIPVQIPSIKKLQGEDVHCNQGDHHDGRVSPSSVTSVLTDLVLASPCKGEKAVVPSEKDSFADMSRGFSSKKNDTSRGSALCDPIDSSYASPSGYAQSAMSKSVSKAPNVHASTRDQFLPISFTTCQKFDISNYKSFYTSLIDRVGRQEEAISSVVQAIANRRMGERHDGASLKGDMWLGFHGSDRIAKKKTALALAELMCGSKENFIYVDLRHQDVIAHPCTICDQQDANVYDVKFRGKTNVDYIAENLRKKPKSVVFVENIDEADFLVQNSLSHAIRNGKFPNSHGREFSATDAIFIVTTATGESKTQSHRDCMNFCEETILAAQCSQMVISVKQFPEDISSIPKSNISGSPRQKSRNKQVSLCSGIITKRKLDTSIDCTQTCESMRHAKRTQKSTTALIDLNMPIEQYEENDADASQTNLDSDGSDSWMEEFFDLLNARVEFKPFNFDALADDIMKDISQRFSSAVGLECRLEIDPTVMVQILAAAWSAEDRGALSRWLDHVLGRSFFELSRRYILSDHTVVRLVASEEAYTEKHATGVVLPSKIILD